MEISPFIVFVVIALFSVIQSIFGVGLLVFGTPTFLLLGISYPEAVGYLLPSSLVLSVLQSHGFKDKIKIARGVVIYAVPFIFLGMLLVVNARQQSILTAVIGLIMLILSIIRIVGVERFAKKIKKFSRISLVCTGVIHGISNQGGALLTVLMSSLYDEKEKIRTNIAFAYLLFGLSQLAVLLWLDAGVVGWSSISYGLVTILLYFMVGRSLFQSIDMKLFNSIFTIFMAVYGLLLLTPVMLMWFDILI